MTTKTASEEQSVHAPEMMEVHSPVTDEVVGSVPRHTPADVIAAVERARAAQPDWAQRSFRERARVIKRFHDYILDAHDNLFDVIQAEAGKSRRDAFVELFAVASEARYYAHHGWKALKPRRVRAAIPFRERVTVHYRPLGVVGVISPWNFPFILTAGDTIPALLAGNSVVIKPASYTPLTAHWLRDALITCGLPSNLLQIVTGAGSVLGNALIDNVDYVMFTGSAEVGRKVAERAGRNLVPHSMELGSKNAMLILPDANLKHSAEVVIEGSFNNAGQVCINFERLYVHDDIYEPFMDELLKQLAQVRLGSDASYQTDIGSLISSEQLAIVEAHVSDAVAKGADILSGGQRRPELGPNFYEPTILTDVTPEMDLHDEETFGPVVAVYRVDSVDDAIRQANNTRYGLHFAVASRDRRKGEQVASRLNAGTVAVNDSYTAWAAMEAPMGGFKDSGIGRRHGPDGIRKYTEPQTISTNRTFLQIGSGETPLSINEWLANLLIQALKLWRRIPFLR